MSAVPFLSEWLATAIEKQRSAFLLIDSAQHQDAYKWLEKSGIPYYSLFKGAKEESLIEIAPLLIPVSELDQLLADKLCAWAWDLGISSPCLSWCESNLSGGALANALTAFHIVDLTDDQSMLMRWYDARILPVWMACLTPAQLANFTGGIFSIGYLNRFGSPAVLYAANETTPLPARPALGKSVIALDDKQLALLIEASELDTLITHLRDVIRDELRPLPNSVLFEFVAKYQQQAKNAGVADLDRVTQYVLLALYTSGKGVTHPSVIALMKDPPETVEDFFNAMQELPEGAWDSGPPLWESIQTHQLEEV